MASITNGWNAVCALDDGLVNALLQQQYLNAGTGPCGAPLAFGIMIHSPGSMIQQPVAALVNLSYPQIMLAEFSSGQKGTATVGAESAQIWTGSAVLSLSPQCLNAQQTAQLSCVQGAVTVNDSLGLAALTFPGGSLDPLSDTYYDGVLQYLANGPFTFPLGTIINTNPGPGLLPTSFDLAIQNDPAGSGSALLILITTSGQPGSQPSLTQYPLGNGVSAALIINEDILWSEVLPGEFGTAFNDPASFGTLYVYKPFEPIVFQSQQAADGTWSMSAISGVADLGCLVISEGKVIYSYSTTGKKHELLPGYCEVELPLAGAGASFDVTASNGILTQSCASSPVSEWGSAQAGSTISPNPSGPVQMSLTYSASAAPSLDAATDIVTFSGTMSSSISLGEGAPEWLENVWSMDELAQFWGVNIDNPPRPFEKGFFPYVKTPSVNAFALGNLLFPTGSKLTFSDVTLPGDLVLTGTVNQKDSVQPQIVSLAPNATQQFTCSVDGVTWSCSPTRTQSITPRACLPPPPLNAATSIRITAYDSSTNNSYFARVTIEPAGTGLVVSPTAMLIGPGGGPFRAISIFATDNMGNPQEVECTTPDASSGLQRLGTGVWSYVPPGDLPAGSNTTITVTSTADPTLTSTIDVNFGTADVVSVFFNQQSGIASASSNAGYTDFFWAVIPAAGGTVVPMSGDLTHAKVTFAQPAPASGCSICAFYVDEDNGVYGFGTLSL